MTLNSKGRLFVLSGPSGAGKGTLRKKVFETLDDNLVFSVSCTTRPPREGEREGLDYRFISEEVFLTLINEGRFLEWARVHGQYYGTLREDVEKALSRGLDVLLEIDVQGALQIKEKMADNVSVFVAPPSIEELGRRLQSRGTEDAEDLKLRLDNAKGEMAKIKAYNHVIINDDATRASEELKKIIKSYRGTRREEE